MNYKLSVIIPVYNAQDTINRAVDSVINQTIGFQNIELVLYDDNSTDNTRSILKKYSEKHNNIVLILSDENSGNAGKGRNEGMKIASADYIMFMDSDDEFLPDICKTLYDEIVKEDADIVTSNYTNINEYYSEIIYNKFRGGDEEYLSNNKRIFLNNDVYDFKDIAVLGKIFKKSTVIQNNVVFAEDKKAEDAYFIYLLLFYVNKVVYLEQYSGYLRHIQKESLSKTADYNEIKGMIDICFDIYYFYKNKDVDFSWFCSTFIGACIWYMYNSNILDDEKKINDLLERLYYFEKETNFNDSYVDIYFKLINKFIMKKQFKLAIINLKILRAVLENQFFMNGYRKIKGMIKNT